MTQRFIAVISFQNPTTDEGALDAMIREGLYDMLVRSVRNRKGPQAYPTFAELRTALGVVTVQLDPEKEINGIRPGHFYVVQYDGEVLPTIRESKQAAMKMVETREPHPLGSALWREHTGHGLCWTWGKYLISEVAVLT